MSVMGTGSSLWQHLDVFLLSLRHEILGNKLIKPFTFSFLSKLFKHIVRWTLFAHSFWHEFECLHSKKVSYSSTTFLKWCLVVLFRINSNADIQRRSGIQSKFLDGCTSNKAPKAGRAYNSSQNDWQENKGKVGVEVRTDSSACRVDSILSLTNYKSNFSHWPN